MSNILFFNGLASCREKINLPRGLHAVRLLIISIRLSCPFKSDRRMKTSQNFGVRICKSLYPQIFR